MAEPHVGEIRMFAGTYAPVGWAFCQGQLLPISENEVLFQLIGTIYGGDGQETFALPDLRGRVPLHPVNALANGVPGGVEEVTLTANQIPVHTHAPLASTSAGGPSPTGSLPGTSTAVDVYRESAPSTALAGQSVSVSGGSQPHTNLQPYLCVHFIISLYGVFPQQA